MSSDERRVDGEPYVSDFQSLQRQIHHDFRNRALLVRALTHPSYVNEHPEQGPDNQRLEFLGDAALGFAVAAWIYQRYPEFQEGEMTRMRAALVREESLARFAAQLGLGTLLRLGRGEEEGGGRRRPANLADAFEALIGALCLDGGLEPAQHLVHALIEPAARIILARETEADAKSRFQEWAQAELRITPRYRIVAERGPDHDKTFVAEALLDERVVGRGQGPSKQTAERAAALDALASTDRWQRLGGE